MAKLYQKIKEKIKENYLLYVILINLKAYFFYYLNKVSVYQYTKMKFYKRLGYPLNLKNPISYNHKLVWKKIYDRNPLLPITADKYQVRSYIREILGEDKAKQLLVPLLYVTDKPETIPFEELPPAFIVKPNHASGRYIIVEDGKFNREKIIDICKKWLVTPYGLNWSEWAYQPIKRKIIIEKLLRDDASILKEFNIFMFHGECKLVSLVCDKINNTSVSYFDETWKFLSVKRPNRPQGPKIKKPENFERILKLAEKLSKPFDHIRVDFYSLNGKIFIGELTHYPGSGFGDFEPSSFSFELGKHWKIEPEYWKKSDNKKKNNGVFDQ